MPERQNPQISTRKLPIQARSTDLVAAVLDAAVQVLQAEGAHRFTTARVAERAGVSVGSLYQYFPNKAAILFRLQSDEWRRTAGLLRDILEDKKLPPPERLRKMVHAFIRSECDEAAVRVALDDAARHWQLNAGGTHRFSVDSRDYPAHNDAHVSCRQTRKAAERARR